MTGQLETRVPRQNNPRPESWDREPRQNRKKERTVEII
jgi:hypothetical protein